MLKCREVTRLLSDAQERKLRIGERTNLYLHMMWCSGCRNFDKQMKSLRHFTRTYVRGKDTTGVELPDKPSDRS